MRFYLCAEGFAKWRCAEHAPKGDPAWQIVGPQAVNLNDCYRPKCETCGRRIEYGRRGRVWTWDELEQIARGGQSAAVTRST